MISLAVLIFFHFPLLQIVHGTRKSAFEPFHTLVWREGGVLGLNDPRKKLLSSVEVGWRRDGHENCRESLLDGNIVQDETQLLDVPPGKLVFCIQGEFDPPGPVFEDTVTN